MMILVIGGSLLDVGPALAAQPVVTPAQGSTGAAHLHLQKRRPDLHYRRIDHVGGRSRAVLSGGDTPISGRGLGSHLTIHKTPKHGFGWQGEHPRAGEPAYQGVLRPKLQRTG
jgi:hypothetical protein